MGSSTVYDVIGLVGSFLIAASLVPQIQKVYRTKSGSDISYSFIFMYITGLSLIVTYGLGESLWPIYIPCSLELVGGISLLAMKYRFDERHQRPENGTSGEDAREMSDALNPYVAAQRLTPK